MSDPQDPQPDEPTTPSETPPDEIVIDTHTIGEVGTEQDDRPDKRKVHDPY